MKGKSPYFASRIAEADAEIAEAELERQLLASNEPVLDRLPRDTYMRVRFPHPQLGWLVRRHPLDHGVKLGKIDGCHLPNDVGIDAMVFVAELVADGDDVRPGYIGIALPQFGRQMDDRFRDDQHGVLDGIPKGEVALEVLERPTLHQVRHQLDVLVNVGKPVGRAAVVG